MLQPSPECILYKTNEGITPEVKLQPEAQPKDTNYRGVFFLLSTLGHKHILMARSEV